ncbi:L-glutamate gamma-semialdehyde dehydrogenase [bacterium]|nr:L-glutamate gamma-semialdehyde dehydrogenase [bacterium]
MTLGIFNIPEPKNEAVRSYLPGSVEKMTLKKELEKQKSNPVEVPVIIGDEEIKTGSTVDIKAPHDLSLNLGKFHQAGEREVNHAIESALEARKSWSKTPVEERAAVFLKAADLLTGPWRDVINAATMLGQSKNVFQSEIEAACELADFWRFNVAYMMDVYKGQPPVSPAGMWNRVTYRPLEGFVFAITPFNFTAIGGNLPTAPAMMGNVCVWKPSSTAVLSNYYLMKILKQAGLPDGVINFVPGKGRSVGDPVLKSPHFAGIHFTGSTVTFNSMWKTVGENLSNGLYKTYPRIVGETGGKDFVFAMPDSEVKALAVALVRGAFEYQGQKCSAASRAYIPASIWPQVLQYLKEMIAEITVGDVCDFRTFMAAVIDKNSFDNIASYIDYAKQADDAEVIIGGEYDDSKGYFVHPTIILTTNPKFKSMEEEIFGPVLTVYVYDDNEVDATMDLLDETSPYALTGAIFGKDRGLLQKASDRLENAAGNFYINDKPTGAVVGQQPFGGARASGTNDKAGSILNLLRWVSPRAIKETFVPPTDFKYPYMTEE